MELEKQVCSLELAKKLKELGVKQESLFWWHDSDNVLTDEGIEIVYSAFTSAELGEMLPKLGGYGWHEGYRDINGVWVCLRKINTLNTEHKTTADTESDARAKMLIYLIKNNLIQLDK